jgi:4a-hydroxytetrahydrobiopterin dehydratase
MDQPVCDLSAKKCRPCEGGVAPLTRDQAERLRQQTPQWELDADARSIRREWVVRNFRKAMEFLNRAAEVAEAQNHHPDLHLTGYRRVRIELSTHAIGGLSENDFIMAARIDELPVELKKPSPA